MAAIQLFLEVFLQSNDPTWYEKLTSDLKNHWAIEQVEIIRHDETKTAQIDISYEMQGASLNQIELIVTNSGASIDSVNIHLPSSVTGFVDPYHASAVSLPLQENLDEIQGVLGGGISSSGEIKIELDPSAKDKQKILEDVLKILP